MYVYIVLLGSGYEGFEIKCVSSNKSRAILEAEKLTGNVLFNDEFVEVHQYQIGGVEYEESHKCDKSKVVWSRTKSR